MPLEMPLVLAQPRILESHLAVSRGRNDYGKAEGHVSDNHRYLIGRHRGIREGPTAVSECQKQDPGARQRDAVPIAVKQCS
jgi:hypothetical protein